MLQNDVSIFLYALIILLCLGKLFHSYHLSYSFCLLVICDIDLDGIVFFFTFAEVLIVIIMIENKKMDYQCPKCQLFTARPYELLQTQSIYDTDIVIDVEEFDGL